MVFNLVVVGGLEANDGLITHQVFRIDAGVQVPHQQFGNVIRFGQVGLRQTMPRSPSDLRMGNRSLHTARP